MSTQKHTAEQLLEAGSAWLSIATRAATRNIGLLKNQMAYDQALPDALAEIAALRKCREALANCEAMMSAIECGHQKPLGFGTVIDDARAALAKTQQPRPYLENQSG